MKILIVRFSSLGDIVLLSPVFRELSLAYPEAQIHFLTSKEFVDIYSHSPYIERQIIYNRKDHSESILSLTRRIAENHYDLVVDAHGSLRSRLLMIFYRLRYIAQKVRLVSIDKRRWRRNLLLWKFSTRTPRNQREAYIDVISRIIPYKINDFSTEIFFDRQIKNQVSKWLKKFGTGKPLIAIGAGASFEMKRWPKEYYLELIKILSPRFQIVLMGAAGEDATLWLQEHLSGIHSVAGMFNVAESAAFLQKCCLSISNDSALSHISEAVGTPAIVIFGPTTTGFGFSPFLPQSHSFEVFLECRPCSLTGKGLCHNVIKNRCLRLITPEAIAQNVFSVTSLLGE